MWIFLIEKEMCMVLKKIKCEKTQRLSKLISDELGIGFNQVQKIIRNKDVKVDGKRVSKDLDLVVGQIIDVYYEQKNIEVKFENDDIVVVFKPRNIETISEKNDNDLITSLTEQLGREIYAVHRLDRNTQGLVVFAKNLKAKDSLDRVIKDRKLEKFYYAMVCGVPEKHEENLIAYLKKDELKNQVYVSDKKQSGYEEIKTNYKLIACDGEKSLLQVELVTGKTHQIRAHLSHIGFPILGDEKYGNSDINKKYKKRYQDLCAFKLVFHFDANDYLASLDGLEIELQKNEIDFLK